MISEVTIKLVGDDIPTFTPIGATVHYGINRIPTATVQLDPSANELLCDFDAVRRSPATLTIETTNGCLYFDGLVDGLSFSQSPGGLSANLVLKHPMQLLAEVYPRLVGVHPASANVFDSGSLLNIDYNKVNGDTMMRTLALYGTNLSFDQNPIDFIVALMTAAVEIQTVIPVTANNPTNTTVGLDRAIAESEMVKKQLTTKVLDLLKSIDTSAVAGMKISAASKGSVDMTLETIAMMRDTVFDNLVRMLADYGCCLIIGSRKAYVVPEASFLRVPKIPAVRRKQRSDVVNVIYPAEYQSFTFNDNGFVNIKGVYVMHNPNTQGIAGVGPANNIDLGIYIDDSASGNILTTTVPQYISYGVVYAAALNGNMHQRIQKQDSVFTSKMVVKDMESAVEQSWTAALDVESRTTYMNQWAQMEYCRMKYDDRTGNISSVFNNNFAPGCVGTLYTRTPGAWLDYFVTDVTHSFVINPPSTGQAVTSINFKSGRMGATADVGLDFLDLYSYGYSQAAEFGNKFLDDIAT